jgi:Zn finger protein HypA/HybF involved in hydrogenase expression
MACTRGLDRPIWSVPLFLLVPGDAGHSLRRTKYMWQCPKCSESIGPSFDRCWRCGTSQDGTEDTSFRPFEEFDSVPSSWKSGESSSPSRNALTCQRCKKELTYIGTKKFHEGTRWGVLGDLGELFVNKEKFDVYCCPICGRVEFFVDGIGEDLRPQ